MSVLKDMFEVDNLIDKFESISDPEDLSDLIQSGKDVFDKHITELKNIPSELERWQSVAQELGVLSENTDYVSTAKDLFLEQAINMSKGTMLEGRLGLENILASKNALLEKENYTFSIGGVKIDYMYNPSPDYSTRAYSQPIVSSSNIDVLSEHAENENTVIQINCILTGDDFQSRFNQINQMRENKQIIQVVANEVFDRVIITRLRPKYDNTVGSLEFSIELENIFVAQLKRAISRKPNVTSKNLAKPNAKKNNLPYGPTIGGAYKLKNPIPPEIKPLPTLNDILKRSEKIGYVAPLKFKDVYKEKYGGK